MHFLLLEALIIKTVCGNDFWLAIKMMHLYSRFALSTIRLPTVFNENPNKWYIPTNCVFISIFTRADYYGYQTPPKSVAVKSKFCCRLKSNLLFCAFWKFPSKFIEFNLFKAKICSPIKNYRISTTFKILELFFFRIFKIFSQTFFQFLGR